MTPHQPIVSSSARSGADADFPSDYASAPAADAVARLAALPTGVAAVVLGSPDAKDLFRVRTFSRQSAGREGPGRPHVARSELIGGWMVDLSKVFAREETQVYALGFGTNALAINVWLGTYEREMNATLGVDRTAVQTDALVFPSLTAGMGQAHGRLLFTRDGRVTFEGRDNNSVFERLQTRTLYLPDVEEPAYHAPMDLVPAEPLPVQSGSALVPGASSAAGDGSERSSLLVLRLVWKPFDYAAPQAPSVWSDGPLG